MQSAGADKFPPQLATFHQSSWSDSLSENRIYIYMHCPTKKTNDVVSLFFWNKTNLTATIEIPTNGPSLELIL